MPRKTRIVYANGRGKRRLAAVVISGVVALAASASAVAIKGAAPSHVKIFVNVPVASPLQDQPEVFMAVRAAARSINAKGGINGHPIDVVMCNNKTDPNATADCARQAVAAGAVANIGMSTLFGQVVYPILGPAKIASIGTVVGSTEADWTDPTAYPIAGGSLVHWMACPFALRRQGGTKMAAAEIDNQAGSYLASRARAAAKSAKIKWVGAVLMPGSAADYTPYAQVLRNRGADSVDLVISAQSSLGLIRAAATLGYKFKWCTQYSSVGQAEVDQLGKDLSEGLNLVSVNPPYNDRSNFPAFAKQYNADVAAAAKAGFPSTDRLDRGNALNGWFATYAFAKIAQTIKGDITAAAVLKALQRWPKKKPIELFGVHSWTPSVPGPAAFPRLHHGRVFFYKVQDGKIILVTRKPVDVFKLQGITP